MLDIFKRKKESFLLLEKYTDQNITDFNQIKDYIRQTFHFWYHGSEDSDNLLESESLKDNSLRVKINEQLPDLIRLQNTSLIPFIREDVRFIIDDFRKKNFYIPKPIYSSPSSFISVNSLEHLKHYFDYDSNVSSDVTNVFNVCLQHFYQFTRFENYIQVMAFHPQYLEVYLDLFNQLFAADLPLKQDLRYFLALVAAAEMRCEYLVNLFARYFISNGGDPEYLNGIKMLPSKWKRLLNINTKLAHQPWTMDKEEIYHLTHRNASINENQDVFSVNEILLAMIIMTHVHALSCFIYGCGITPELDHPEALIKKEFEDRFLNQNPVDQSKEETCQDPEVEIHEKIAMEKFLQVLRLNVISISNDDDLVHKQFDEVCNLNSKLDRFQPTEWLEIATQRTLSTSNLPTISVFLHNKISGYSSFTGTPRQFQTSDWIDECIPLVDQLCCDIASSLDMTSKAAYELTYHRLNAVDNVDTSAYRLTIWNIVLSFFGLFNDEFNYSTINQLLPLKERAYLKRCFTRPYEIQAPVIKEDSTPIKSPYDYAELMPALQPSEVVHVMIMSMEARRQACLFYALKATSQCQSMSSHPQL